MTPTVTRIDLVKDLVLFLHTQPCPQTPLEDTMATILAALCPQKCKMHPLKYNVPLHFILKDTRHNGFSKNNINMTVFEHSLCTYIKQT